jgi:hypothetical protein
MLGIKLLALSAGFLIVPALAAPVYAAKAPFPVAADGTTNIKDCAAVGPQFRNECISRSRPVTGKEIYAASKPVAAKVAPAAKVKATVPAAVANVPKGFKVNKDGTTNVADCAQAKPQVRNECISRARPLTGKELAKYIKDRAKSVPVEKAVAAKPAVKATPVVTAAPAAKVVGKGFVIAKDGTTNIADCAKANPAFRNECISRSRPLTGREIYGTGKAAPKA